MLLCPAVAVAIETVFLCFSCFLKADFHHVVGVCLVEPSKVLP